MENLMRTQVINSAANMLSIAQVSIYSIVGGRFLATIEIRGKDQPEGSGAMHQVGEYSTESDALAAAIHVATERLKRA